MKHLTCFFMLALAGCSESRVDPLIEVDSATDAAVTPDVAATPDATVSPDVSVTPDASVTPDVGAAGRLVINEISAAGDEWVELFNAGAAPIDLSDVQLADSESDGGARLSRAMRFPRGAMLSPGQYVLVLANQSDAGAGPQTTCLDGGPTTCFHAGWSLSASRGETVWVLSPTGDAVARELYPMNATDAGSTWGRLPNGTGAFAVNRPTPGASNAAP